MICCLNPDCPSPLNPSGKKFCTLCKTPLVSLLRNRFHVISVLSDEGGFGRTYLAEDIDKLNERCVIKQLAPKVQGHWALKKAMELFQKEAERLQELGEHPQIPTLLAYFEQDNYLYLVQQYIDGNNLLKELQQRKSYSSSDIKEILLDLLPVLKFIHEKGVIHRDIKPQNIIRRRVPHRSNSRKIRGNLVLIDFGSAKQLTAKVQMNMGTSIGSQGYSPIEQIRDGAAYPSSDLFSLGATCFHLLTGVSPFKLWTENGYGWIQNWQQYLRSPISGDVERVLDKLLQKNINQRYQSVNEAIADLTVKQQPPPRLISNSTPVVSSNLPPTQQPSLPKQYIFIRNSMLIGAFILLLGSGEFWYRQFRRLEMKISSSLSQPHNSATSPDVVLDRDRKTPLGSFSLVSTVRGYSNAVLSIAISPDGKTIASNSGNGVKLLSLVTGQEIATLSGHYNKVNALAISPDGQFLASGSEDQTSKIWNLATGQEVRTLRGHTNSIHAIAFSHEGKMLADGSSDNTIKLWNVVTGEEISTIAGHNSAVRSLAFSPDRKTLASGGFDETIKLWNLETGHLIHTLQGHTDKVTSIAISSDGKLLASGSFDKTIKLWNLETGQLVDTLLAHTDRVTSIAISPDGKLLASGSFDKTIKLWNLETGKQVRILLGHSNRVYAVAFSSDGKTLVSGSEDNTIKIWRVSR
ncbi:MAG: serine/threonine-protein kinase [Scytonema sp. PMC 1069.18]|nr:serine/threonine-protein kinase [Scytonema sp. PMC 1069.18]MEC4885272.1 serine/threonine-protein kinase [Scytonema sp. PMC 1070.18]